MNNTLHLYEYVCFVSIDRVQNRKPESPHNSLNMKACLFAFEKGIWRGTI